MASNPDVILLKIKLDETRLGVKIEKLNADIKKLDATHSNYTTKVEELAYQEARLNEVQQKRVAHTAKISKSNEDLSKSITPLNKKLQGTEKSSGAAATSVLELGRVVSDAPYGIRGMANNVSQLASNMLFGAQQIDKTTGKAVGFSSIIKSMGKVFIGPLGILFAIQAVIAAFDFFYGGMKKAENASKELSQESQKTVGTFMRLNDILQDNRNSLEDKKEALRILKKEYPEAIELIDTYSKGIDGGNVNILKAIELEKEYTKILISAAKERAAVKKIEEEAGELVELADKREVELRQTKKFLLDKAILMEKSDRDAIENSVKVMESQFDLTKTLGEQSKAFTDSFLILSKYQSNLGIGRVAVDDFTNSLFKNREEMVESSDKIERLSDVSKGLFKDSGKEFKKLTKELEKLSISELQHRVNINKAIINNESTTKDEKLRLTKEAYQLSLSILRKEKEFRNKDLTDSELDNAKRKNSLIKFNDEHIVLQVKLRKDLKKILQEGDRDRVDLLGLKAVQIGEEAKKAEKVLQAVLSAMQIDKLKVNPLDLNSFLRIDTTLSPEAQAAIKAYNRAIADRMIKESQTEDMLVLIDSYKQLMTGVTQFIDGEYDRQLVIEENKTNAMNEELNNRLLNENVSKETRKDIQNQIWQNDEKLRKKQQEIEKKKFMQQKAFNIASATMDTFAAGAAVLKDTDGGTLARIAGMIAVVGSGLAQVASIARTKFQSSSAATPINTASGGGGSGGGADREFNFNLVGNTQGNQLVDAIQGQFKTPIKAFVVSKDITTQQELDTNIKGSATF